MNILEEVLYPSVRTLLPAPEPIWLVQDNCPAHTSLVARDWFRRHPDVQLIHWPAKSPDLNPIENLWGSMVLQWEPADERTPEALHTHCQAMWESFRGRPQFCHNLVASMNRRCAEVLAADGGHVKY